MRAAIYFTPAQDDPLTQCAADWLGRDAFTGRKSRLPDPSLDPHVADAARYGFHATIKAPFRLAPGRTYQTLDDRLARFSREQDAVVLGELQLNRLDGYFALTPSNATTALAALEDEVRSQFDEFRAALTEAEIARRGPDQLTERQRQNLLRWGYPHVGPDFRFHMTLGAVPAAATEANSLHGRLRSHFDGVLGRPVNLDALTLFVEPAPGEPFQAFSRHVLSAPIPLGVKTP